jgi:hypothetical protein
MSNRDPIRYDSLVQFGYVFKKHSTCKACQQAIEWWKTKNGKDVCFDPARTPSSIVVCHWNSCPARKEQAPPPTALNHQVAVTEFRKRSRARVVMVLLDDTWYADVMPGLEAEDAKCELITAANALRRAMGGR